MEILTYPNKILAGKSKPIDTINDRIQKLIDDMAETMYVAPGVGLAAPQVGCDLRIIVFDPEADPEKRLFRALINPVIVESTGEMMSENEGCLSLPEFRADVKRAIAVRVEGLDRDGSPVAMDAEGLLSVILQHEIDHLDGVLFIDRISALKRELYKRKVRKKIKQG